MGWTIAPVEVADADEVGRVHVRVWQEAYAGLMPAAYLDALDPTRSPRAGDAGCTSRVPGVHTSVARDDDGIVGIATAGPSRDDDPPTPEELYAINVLARGHGTGVADGLLAATIGDRAGLPVGGRRQRPRDRVLPPPRVRRRRRPQAGARHRGGRDPDGASRRR